MDYKLLGSEVLDHMKESYESGKESGNKFQNALRNFFVRFAENGGICYIKDANGGNYFGITKGIDNNDLEIRVEVLPKKYINYLIPLRDICDIEPFELRSKVRKSSV